MLITGKRNNAVLISEEDWRSVQETLYLMSIPGMRESILEGMSAPKTSLLSEKEFFSALNKTAPKQPRKKSGKK